jgi:long-chain fatty acid transport protein
MKNVSLRIAAVAIALAAAAPAAATNGMRLTGFSPVQNSMGGAAAAAPLDAATIVSNPAGMSALDRRLDVSGSAFMSSASYDANGGSSISSDRPTDFVPTVGAIYKTAENLTVGVAAVGMGGLGVDYGADPSLGGVSNMTSYLNMRLAPAASYRLSDQVSVGLAVNLMYAQLEYAVGGMTPRDAAGSFGYGATVGLSWKTPEKVSLAVVYESQSRFQDFSWDVNGATEKMSFDQPDVATVGAAFQPMAALLVAADVQWIRWSSTNGKNKPEFTEATPATMPFNMNWSDQFVFKLGAQYDLSKELKLRAGYNYGKHPLDQTRAFENIVFPAIAQHHYTVGAGYQLGSITVNASALYAPEVKLSGTNTQQRIASYETKLSQLAFDLGATWKF